MVSKIQAKWRLAPVLLLVLMLTHPATARAAEEAAAQHGRLKRRQPAGWRIPGGSGR